MDLNIISVSNFSWVTFHNSLHTLGYQTIPEYGNLPQHLDKVSSTVAATN